MTTKTLPARHEIAPEYKWNLEAIYPQDAQWETEYAALGPLLEEVKQYRGRLGESGQTLLAALKLRNNIDEEGQEVELTQGRYIRYMRSYNRSVREQSFKQLHAAFGKQRNTIATCYSSQVKTDMFYSRARKFNSSLEAALFHDNIPVSVYENLIQAVHDNMDIIYRYMGLRKRLLGLPKLHMYDLHVPLVLEINENIPYNRATEMVTEAFAP